MPSINSAYSRLNFNVSRRRLLAQGGGALALAVAGRRAVTPARAEPSEVRVVRQYGIGFLPLMVMEEAKLFEREAEKLGLSTKASWITLGGPSAANEALLSGAVDIIPNGSPAFLSMWSRSQGTRVEVKGIGSLVTLPMWLNTRNPKIHSIRDFTDSDRIAMSAIKTSISAIVLQMAAAKEWGTENFSRLDKLTVALPHPDGMSALLSGHTEVNAHFTSPPYQEIERAAPGVRTILTSNEVLGGQHSFGLIFTTVRFRNENPKSYEAFYTALLAAQKFIRENKEKAADIYLKYGREGGVSREMVIQILNDPSIQFVITPNRIMEFARFMEKVGTLKVIPVDWKDAFFPEIHDLAGS